MWLSKSKQELNPINLGFEQIRHGGDLQEAIKVYGGQQNEWLDLSTGISPWTYPIPKFPEKLWRDLPEQSAALKETAATYYCCYQHHITIAPGSQLAIRLLPSLVDTKHSVAIPLIGYQEHLHAWRLAGHDIVFYRTTDELEELSLSSRIDSAVTINPNNPSGATMSPKELNNIASKLSGLLIVDEAFADIETGLSIIDKDLQDNVVVLRSLGKFFGLAGARIGFVISGHAINRSLHDLLSPWSLSAPSQYIAERALGDNNWQEFQKKRAMKQSSQISKYLNLNLSKITQQKIEIKSTGLFNSVFSESRLIEHFHNKLAEQKVWSRIGDKENDTNWLRLGLAGNEINRLRNVIESIC